MTGTHHTPIYNGAGIKIGYVRITNDAVVKSIWLHQMAVQNYGLFVPFTEEEE
jgi:hypothetical protein